MTFCVVASSANRSWFGRGHDESKAPTGAARSRLSCQLQNNPSRKTKTHGLHLLCRWSRQGGQGDCCCGCSWWYRSGRSFASGAEVKVGAKALMSVTSPTKVWRQRGSRRSDPLSPGSNIFRKVLPTTNAIPLSMVEWLCLPLVSVARRWRPLSFLRHWSSGGR